MRCPKCGYNSFDHLDSCKKCSKDLTEHKARFNIQSILLSEMPAEAMAAVADDAVAAAVAPEARIDDFTGSETTETDIDDFGFDFMGDSEDDENLAFDELFEEVPAEEDVEEALDAPERPSDEPETPPEPVPLDQELATEGRPAVDTDTAPEEFRFDASEDAVDELEVPADVSAEDPTEFGFDNDEDPAADIFAETEEDFSLDPELEKPDKG